MIFGLKIPVKSRILKQEFESVTKKFKKVWQICRYWLAKQLELWYSFNCWHGNEEIRKVPIRILEKDLSTPE